MVVERGGRWPGRLENARLNARDVVLIAQQPDESPAMLARRVIRRAAALEARCPVELGVIAAGPSTDDDVLEARSLIAVRMLRAQASRQPEMIVSVNATDDDARRHVSALNDILTLQLGLPGEAVQLEVAQGSAVPVPVEDLPAIRLASAPAPAPAPAAA